MKRVTTFLWAAIVVLFQLVLAAVLITLILGEGAGPVVNSVTENTKNFLLAINPASVAVAGILLFFWQLYERRLSQNDAAGESLARPRADD